MCVTVWVLRYKNKKNGDRGTIVFTATLRQGLTLKEFLRVDPMYFALIAQVRVLIDHKDVITKRR